MTLTPFQLGQVQQGAVGNDAGWVLTFHRAAPSGTGGGAPLELSSADYHATIDAALPEGLDPGAYRVTIEGLTDEHFAKLRTSETQPPLVCKLYLFWRDANTSAAGYLANLAGVTSGPSADELHESLVAVLRVTKVRRRAAERTYDTELTMVEEAYARLGGQRVAERLEAANLSEAVGKIAERTGVELARPWGANPNGTMTRARGEAAGDERITFGEGLLYLEAVRRLARQLEHSLNLYGRGMVLIRDGTVHVGKRPIPFPEGEPKPLTLATGLLEPVEDGEEGGDAFAATEAGGDDPPRRTAWTLTLKGRPDLKPGNVVRFEPPAVDEASTRTSLGAAAAGAFAAPFLPATGGLSDDSKHLYVSSVRHTLSRTAGFVTVARGVEVSLRGDEAWDTRPDVSSSPASPDAPAAAASPGVAAAEAVRRTARLAAREGRGVEVGEVRAVATNARGAVEPPAQTETVWEGAAGGDGRANGARRLPIRRDPPSPLNGVAYLTPFAWGGCGLVLPRYPGTRVVLAFRNGQADDPVELGAIWPSGRAPLSQPGDWWLSLPVGVATDRRSTMPDGAVPADHGGKVAHDLVDGDGNRVIELGELTVRVGRSKLKGTGQRPARAADPDSITIEHAGGGSRIVLKQDGSITIAGSRIDLDAGGGTINLKAATVDVQVTNAMEVR